MIPKTGTVTQIVQIVYSKQMYIIAAHMTIVIGKMYT